MLVNILWILICIFGALFGIYHFFGNRELYNKTKHINGPRTFPLIGSAYKMIGNSSHAVVQAIKMSKEYCSPYRLVIGPKVVIVVTDPEQIQHVLQNPKTVEKDSVYDFAKSWWGNGLLTSKHKIWREHRKMIRPTFSNRILQSFVSIFQKNALWLTQAVKNNVGGPEFQIHPFTEYTKFLNVCESSMGISFETHKKEDIDKALYATSRALKLLFERLFCFWLHSDKLYNLSQLSKDSNECIKCINNLINKVIHKKRQAVQSVSNNDQVTDKKQSTLDLLIKLSDNENKLTDNDLRDHVSTFIFTGTDTTAREIDFIFLMLAQYPKIQNRVYEEIFNIYGSEDPETRPVQYEDLNQLTYLERVIKETLRLFPIVPTFARHVSEDLDLGGCNIPKGCSIAILNVALHRDEKYFPDPLKFDPDRFLPEEISKRHPCAFNPFGFGARDCIGRVYAMISLKLTIVTFLRKYVLKKDKFTEPGDIKLSADVILSTAEPICLRIENRVN